MSDSSPPRSVYLAGPDVFLPDSTAVIAAKSAMCEEFGFIYHPPVDRDLKVPPAATPTDISRLIYAADVALLRASDFGIFNLTPFRGPSADVGTCVELGMMSALGKPCFAYSNIAGDYLDRVAPRQSLPERWGDADGWTIENFGNADNLMIDGAVAASGVPVIRNAAALPERLHDLIAFRRCLAAARDHFAKGS